MTRSLIFGIIIFSLALVGGSYFLLAGNASSSQELPEVYRSEDKEKPKAETKEIIKDLGEMKVSDEKAEIFSIKNTGNKPLALFNISSSCGCTVGQVVVDGKESEEFGMHSKSDYRTELKPGKEAKVKVTYRPFVMPVSGAVERDVFVETNDPDNSRLVFRVKAFVK